MQGRKCTEAIGKLLYTVLHVVQTSKVMFTSPVVKS